MPDVRGCLYTDEQAFLSNDSCFSHSIALVESPDDSPCIAKKLDILEDFSQSGCIYECKLNTINFQDEMMSEYCLLWDHPNVIDGKKNVLLDLQSDC